MAQRFAIYLTRDHRDGVSRSWIKPLSGEARADQAQAPEDNPGAEFIGICHATGPARLDCEGISQILAASPSGRTSAVYERLARRRRGHDQKPKRAAFRLSAARRSEWFTDGDHIPAAQRAQFREHTFLFCDGRDGSYARQSVFLPLLGFEQALADFVASEGWWEPVALFEGMGRLEFASAKIAMPAAGSQRVRVQPASDPAPALKAPQPQTPPKAETESDGALETLAIGPQMVADTLASLLMRFAVEKALGQNSVPGRIANAAGAGPLEPFRAHLLAKRPLILIETVHFELAPNIGRFIATLAGLKVRSERRAAVDVLGGGPERAQPRVILFEKSDFERGFNDADKELDNRIRNLVQQGDIGIVVTDALSALPGALRLNRDLELRLPDITGQVRAAVLTSLFGAEAQSSAEDDSWSRYASALDFEKIAFAGLKGPAAIKDLAERVKGRLARMGAIKGMKLADIHGLGQAKTQAEIFIADIEAYLASRIPWSEVDRGMLLVGPPGTGKTMLAKAISKETGVRFIHASASEWQASSHLGEHIQSIRNSFSMARRFAPSILFIDEFDSIGRRGHGGQNEFYHTAVVNCVLEELQGFEDREGVVVIAATNRAEGVDAALKRAGRLDRIVEVHYPTIDALEKIYAYYIGEQKKQGLEHGPLTLRELARLTFGQTGADVELYMRGAARRARMRANQGGSGKIAQDDIVAEIMKSPTGESGAVRLTPDEMRRVAVHEAGHALVRLTGPDKGATISYLSITPRSDGTLGFVFNAPDERHTRTREDLREIVRMLFGGRAAESVVFGENAISSGSGGPSPQTDLAQATRLVTAMAGQFGFSRKGGLVWRTDALPENVEGEVRRELDQLYKEARARILKNRRLLDKIVKILIEKQEITGPDLRALLRR